MRSQRPVVSKRNRQFFITTTIIIKILVKIVIIIITIKELRILKFYLVGR
jgi:hypothetical protein